MDPWDLVPQGNDDHTPEKRRGARGVCVRFSVIASYLNILVNRPISTI